MMIPCCCWIDIYLQLNSSEHPVVSLLNLQIAERAGTHPNRLILDSALHPAVSPPPTLGLLDICSILLLFLWRERE